MSDFIADIPKRLKITRLASGFKTAKEFTKKFSIPASTYSQHENGKRVLTLENIVYYAGILNIEPTWLVTGQGNPCGEYENQLEEKILEEQQRFIDTKKLNESAIPMLSMEKNFSFINTMVFKNILLEIIPLLKQINESNIEEMLDFCFELYNRIIVTQADNAERLKIIRVCLESFFKGLGIRVTDELLRNVTKDVLVAKS